MANLTITVTAGLNLFGESQTTKWGFSWGNAKWGYGGNGIPTKIGKFVADSFPVWTDQFAKNQRRVIGDFLAPISSNLSEMKMDGGAWTYEFVGPTTEGQNRPPNTFAPYVNASQAWVTAVTSPIVWV